jgi:hypothetical protein
MYGHCDLFSNHISSFLFLLKATFRNVSKSSIYEVAIRRIIPQVSTQCVERFGRNYRNGPELLREGVVPTCFCKPLITRYLRVGGLQVDQAAGSTLLNGKELELTSKEFDVLVRLAQNPGVVVSAEALASQIWGPGLVHHNQNLRLHNSKLRKKARSASADFIGNISSNAYVAALQQSARPQGWTFLSCCSRQCGPTFVRGGMTCPLRPF